MFNVKKKKNTEHLCRVNTSLAVPCALLCGANNMKIKTEFKSWRIKQYVPTKSWRIKQSVTTSTEIWDYSVWSTWSSMGVSILHTRHHVPLSPLPGECQKGSVALHELRALRDIPLQQSETQYVVPSPFHRQTFTALFKLERREKQKKR